MNYIKHLTGFFEKVTNDKQLNPTHISLYIALFQFWNCNRFRNPISISRDEVMRISKISSKATYHKCLKALHAQGYIKYEPSYNPFKGSHVFLFNFSDDLKPLLKSERTASPNFKPVDEQVLNKSFTSAGTSTEVAGEQVLVPSINNTNITNNQNDLNGLNAHEPPEKNETPDSDLKGDSNEKKEKGSAEKEKREMPDATFQENKKTSSPAFADLNAKRTETAGEKWDEKEKVDTTTTPAIEEVLSYFNEQQFPEIEANKFFNYFKSIGWLVGGKTQMADWQAAARNWMLNAPKFITYERTDRTRDFDSSTGKDYSEPL